MRDLIRWVRRKRTVHTSWIIAATCIGVVLGVVLARFAPISMFSSIAWLLTSILMFGLCMVRPRLSMLVIALVSGVLAGAWRGSVTIDELRPYAALSGRSVTLTGIVADDIEINTKGKMVVRLREVRQEDRRMAGQIWLTAESRASLRRSDELTITGKLGDGFGSFAATIYDAKIKSVNRPVPGDVAIQMRDWFASKVRSVIGEPASTLGLGFLTGQHRNLPEALEENLKIVGLTHIIVASGYNLTILVRFARRSFSRISKYLSLLAAGSLTVGFITIAGISPSMSRAGLVTGLSLMAWYYGRTFNPYVLLSLVMAVTVMVQPEFAWGDLGWLLSFAAFFGVLVMAPLLTSYLFGGAKIGLLRQVFIETFCAWLCTLPVLVYSFGQFSVLAILANVLVLPFLPIAMFLTFGAGVSASILVGLAVVPGYLANVVLTYIIQIASSLATVPWAKNEIEIPLWAVWLMYGLIGLSVAYMTWRAKKESLDITASTLV